MKNILNNRTSLFDGDDKLFKFYLKDCQLYFEYGVGKSTKWVLDNTNSNIIAVDSDKEWIDSINVNNYKSRIKFIWVNLGELSKWGRPVSYKYRNKFTDYVKGVWNSNVKADVVLIDGRFRVACFLNSLLNSKVNTFIIFDDYINRPWYHVVEEVLPMLKKNGRQGVFKVPSTFNRNLAKQLLRKFIYVFD